MAVIGKKTFLTEKSTTGDSEILYNINTGETLTLEVTGTATSITLSVKGIVGDYNESAWSTLGVMGATTTTMASTISSAGIYRVNIEGVVKVKITVDAITGGNVSVVGKVSA